MLSILEFIGENKDDKGNPISLRGSLQKQCACFSIKPEYLSVRQILIDNYYILVIGDSVIWGQGLNENDKFYYLIEKQIQSEIGDIKVYKNVLAHSGATIGSKEIFTRAPLYGEIPTSYPTIIQQCHGFTGLSRCVDLVLINGGINDINVRTILNPFLPDSDLVDSINQYCYKDMLLLLKNIIANFSKANVVVAGYYPLVSKDSDLLLLGLLLVAVGIVVGGPLGGAGALAFDISTKDAMVRRSQIFASQSAKNFKQAIDEVCISDVSSSYHISLAVPLFDEKNCIFGSEPWLFGINSDLSPQDYVAARRRIECEKAVSSYIDLFTCKIASVGHPNSIGAKEYARVIKSFIS